MRFQISYDNDGKPCHVSTDDGFMMTSGAFEPDRDGWMLDQLDPADFPAIQIGQDMAALVAEVNHLRRQLFMSKSSEERVKMCDMLVAENRQLFRRAGGAP